MFKFFLFTVTQLLYFFSFIFLKKTRRNESLLVWTALSILIVFISNAFLGGVYGLFNIPVSVITISPVILILSIGLFIRNKKMGKQQYYFNRQDLYFIVVLGIVTLLFWLVFFRFHLLLRFVSVDASVHARFAKQLALTHTISNNMFLAYLNDGLVMEAFLPFIGEIDMMKIFVFMRIFDFFIVGLMFYSFLSVIESQDIIAKIVITVLYLIGYPLYTIIFGFVYFGTSVTMIIGLLVIIKLLETKTLENSILTLFLLNAFLFSIFATYTLFVPPVFLGIFIYLNQNLKKQNISFYKLIFEDLKIFVLPCFLGLLYSYVNLKEMSAGTGGAITNEGGNYFDLYSNFIFLIPFVISNIYRQLKENICDSIILVFFSVVLFTVVLFVGSLFGKVSIYYLSKMYNLLWLFSWYYTFKEILYIKQLNKPFIYACAFELSILFAIMGARLDERINTNKTYVHNGADNFLNIYYFNSCFILGTNFVDQEIGCFSDKVKSLTLESDNILFVGSEINSNWFKTYYGDCYIKISDDIECVEDFVNREVVKYFCYENAFVTKGSEKISDFGKVFYVSDFGTIVEVYN